MSEISQDEKQGALATALGTALMVVFLVAGVVLWALPTATRGAVSGESIGLPFTGTGACFLSMAGLLIASIGWRLRKSARGPRAPEPPIRKPPRPAHGEWPAR